jgi:hypothetical protein
VVETWRPSDAVNEWNDATGAVERVGGVKYTIKDGIIYDAKQLLADVAAMVERQKRERLATQPQPAR